MKTKILLFLTFLSTNSLIFAQSVILPTGMISLTGTDVTVTSVDNTSRTKCDKPVVKTTNNLVFFTASTTTYGEELWVTDLTVAGTHMVKDINTGTTSSNPRWLTAIGNKVYFVATTIDKGEELWVSDGTDAGTKNVKDIYAGNVGSSPFGLTAFNGKLLFFAMDEESEGLPVIDPSKPEKWLWVSDGTDAGTLKIGKTPTKENNFDSQQGYIVPCGNKAFFVGYDLTNNESLWLTDGTQSGTKVIKNINPRSATTGVFATAAGAIDHITNVNNKKVVFRAETVSEVTGTTDVGSELWVSDGTATGTNWIGFDFAKGLSNGVPIGTQMASTVAFGDTLFFRADDGVHGVEPCLLDISKPFVDGVNPKMYFDVNHWSNNPQYASWPSNFYEYKGSLYLQANGGYYMPANPTQQLASGYSLWRGPLNHLDSLKYCNQIWNMEIYPGGKTDACAWFTQVNGRLFFAAINTASNKELWVIDNENAAPQLVVDLPGNGLPCQLMNVNENLVFMAQGTKALYKYDAKITGVDLVYENTHNLKIYPNPSSDNIYLTAEKEISQVSVVDLTGKMLINQNYNSNISIGNLAKGTYLLKAKFIDGSTSVNKFFVK